MFRLGPQTPLDLVQVLRKAVDDYQKKDNPDYHNHHDQYNDDHFDSSY